MSSVDFDFVARRWTTRIEDAACEALGHNLPEARAHVARDLAVAPGSLENLRKGRIKGVRGSILHRLAKAVIPKLEAELVQIQAELAMARQIGLDPASQEVAAIKTDFADVKALLTEIAGAPAGSDRP